MKKFWNNLLEMLLVCHKFNFKTKLPTERVLKWAELFVKEYYNDYNGWIMDDGFLIKERTFKSFGFGYSKNTMAPIASVKIEQEGDLTNIFVTLRPDRLTQAVCIFFYIVSVIGVFASPDYFVILLFLVLFLYFSVFRPSCRLKKRLMDYFASETVSWKMAVNWGRELLWDCFLFRLFSEHNMKKFWNNLLENDRNLFFYSVFKSTW